MIPRRNAPRRASTAGTQERKVERLRAAAASGVATTTREANAKRATLLFRPKRSLPSSLRCRQALPRAADERIAHQGTRPRRQRTSRPISRIFLHSCCGRFAPECDHTA